MSEQQKPTSVKEEDNVARPLGFMVSWGIPIFILVALNISRPTSDVATAVIVAVFVWMGAACLLNAKRCRRRHCFYSGPIFLIGAVATALVGYGIVDLGPDGLVVTTWGTAMAVALTFVPELIWGKYRD